MVSTVLLAYAHCELLMKIIIRKMSFSFNVVQQEVLVVSQTLDNMVYE